jgi:radical SAM superfamily enzyme YgiQ (UPF0313 family)
MKPNRIALINPPSPFLINQRVFPNLGLLDVATSLKENGESVSLIDLCGFIDPEMEITKIAHQFDIFGFSSTTPQFLETYKLHKLLKRQNPEARTIIGGAHPSAMYSVLQAGKIKDPNLAPLEEFDHIVVGEGENLNFFDLKKGWIITPLIKDINKLPIPDRSLIDIKSYEYFLDEKPATTIMTQRGCPFKCTFCCGREIDMYRKVRSKSPERLVEELDYLHGEFGFNNFMWFDDEINVNPGRLRDLSKKLRLRPYSHRGFVRSDLLVKHPETLDDLAEAGFVELCSGVESGSEEILRRVNKGTTPEINSQAAQMIKNKGLAYKAFTIIGHPGETYNDIERTKQWLIENNPDGFDVSILSPYPGSILYDHSIVSAKYKGFDREWNGLYFKQPDYSSEESFYKGKPGEYSCNTRTDELTSKDLLRIRDEMETEIKDGFN